MSYSNRVHKFIHNIKEFTFQDICDLNNVIDKKYGELKLNINNNEGLYNRKVEQVKLESTKVLVDDLGLKKKDIIEEPFLRKIHNRYYSQKYMNFIIPKKDIKIINELNLDSTKLVNNTLDWWVKNNWVQECDKTHIKQFLPCSFVLKKDDNGHYNKEKLRLVVNSSYYKNKVLNNYSSFDVDISDVCKYLIDSNTNYGIKIDIEGGFNNILINDDDSSYFGFMVKNKCYRYKVLPQGFTNSPYYMNIKLKEIINKLQFDKCQIFTRQDDILILGEKDNCENVFKQIEKLFSLNNIRLNHKKLQKGNKLTFLKMEWDFTNKNIYINEVKKDNIKDICHQFNNQNGEITKKDLKSFVSKINYLLRCEKPLYFGELFNKLKGYTKKNKFEKVNIDRIDVEELFQLLNKKLSFQEGKNRYVGEKLKNKINVYLDSSKINTSFISINNTKEKSVYWNIEPVGEIPKNNKDGDNNTPYCEVLGLYRVLEKYLLLKTKKPLYVYTDNSSVLKILNTKLFKSKVEKNIELLEKIQDMITKNHIVISGEKMGTENLIFNQVDKMSRMESYDFIEKGESREIITDEITQIVDNYYNSLGFETTTKTDTHYIYIEDGVLKKNPLTVEKVYMRKTDGIGYTYTPKKGNVLPHEFMGKYVLDRNQVYVPKEEWNNMSEEQRKLYWKLKKRYGWNRDSQMNQKLEWRKKER